MKNELIINTHHRTIEFVMQPEKYIKMLKEEKHMKLGESLKDG